MLKPSPSTASSLRSTLRRVGLSRVGLNSVSLAGFVALGLGIAAWPAGKSLPVLHASPSASLDDDGDGLSNLAEQVLGSSRYLVDTDGDGYGDLEEFARGSDPGDVGDKPLPGALSLSMSASGEDDGLHLQIAAFYTDGNAQNKEFQIGVVLNELPRFFPGALSEPGVTISRYPTEDGASGVLLLDVPFSEDAVHALGNLSIFATLSLDSAPLVVAAASVDLISIDGVLTILQSGPFDRWQALNSGGGAGNPGGPSAGSIYRPIPTGTGGGIPTTWTPGEICFQASIEIGSDGGVITHEVVAADCISDFDSSCPPSCASSVGEVFQTFDPIGLIGG
ncbi:MAG: hypothetical protein ACI9F9_000896 [Candidatus Paceibacteria bacterium]|jgi:hypothetical protein